VTLICATLLRPVELYGTRNAAETVLTFSLDARRKRWMESTPVRMTVKWRVPAGEALSITTALQTLMQHTRAAQGCSGCSFSTEMDALVVIHYLETWKTEGDLRRQLRSDRFASLAELIERATERPLIEFSLPDGLRGIEYAQEVRRMDEVH
jgi:quinol monooxygenase YgiN